VFAALFFNTGDADVDNETIPSYVSYKIRMDIDRVDSTSKFKVTDRLPTAFFDDIFFLLLYSSFLL